MFIKSESLPELAVLYKVVATSLDVLPSSSSAVGLPRVGKGIEAEAVANVASRDSGIGDRSIDAPVRGVTLRLWAGHEAGAVPPGEGPVAEGLTGLILEWTDGGTGGDVDGVSLGEGESAGGVDVDELAAGNFDILLKVISFVSDK